MLFLAWCVAGAQSANPDANALEDFQKRVSEYMKVHDRARAGVGKLKPTASPERIAQHERLLAHKIRVAREDVGQGNIFTVEISTAFRRLTGEATKGVDATTVHQSLRRSEPVVFKLRVNHKYPEGVPLQSTPPSLLQNLPKLPHELEYRVVGHDLVLLDTSANLVADYLPGAIP